MEPFLSGEPTEQPGFPVSHLGQVRDLNFRMLAKKRAQVQFLEDGSQLPQLANIKTQVRLPFFQLKFKQASRSSASMSMNLTAWAIMPKHWSQSRTFVM